MNPRTSAVIFDLDGTLTRPMLDFDGIRAEIGIERGPILEAISRMTDSERRRAHDVLLAHERRAAEDSTLQDGAADVIETLRRRGFPAAILTRNARRWTDFVLAKHGLEVDAIRTRDDGTIKPSGEPILSLCQELGAVPERSWMVGDYLFDLVSGRQAKTRTVLMLGENPEPDYLDQADFVIRRLPELLPLILPAP